MVSLSLSMIYKKHSDKTSFGFTIVELLIVIVVIGILAAITIVSFNGVTSKANVSKSQSDLKNMQKLIEMYKVDNGTYPNTSQNWYFSDAAGASGGDGFIPGVVPTYAKSLPRPTAGAYIYISNGTDYKIMRYNAIPSGEWAAVPTTLIDGTGATNKDRFGYWTPGGLVM